MSRFERKRISEEKVKGKWQAQRRDEWKDIRNDVDVCDDRRQVRSQQASGENYESIPGRNTLPHSHRVLTQHRPDPYRPESWSK